MLHFASKILVTVLAAVFLYFILKGPDDLDPPDALQVEN
jgi:hypothetical protein